MSIFSSGQVLTHRSGSAVMLSLIYSEILKTLRLWGLLNFDVEIFFPHDLHSLPRGYQKQKSKFTDDPHILTSDSLLVEVNCYAITFCLPYSRKNNALLTPIFTSSCLLPDPTFTDCGEVAQVN